MSDEDVGLAAMSTDFVEDLATMSQPTDEAALPATLVATQTRVVVVMGGNAFMIQLVRTMNSIG